MLREAAEPHLCGLFRGLAHPTMAKFRTQESAGNAERTGPATMLTRRRVLSRGLAWGEGVSVGTLISPAVAWSACRLAAAALLCFASRMPAQISAKQDAYLNPAVPLAERVDDLVGRMTLDEKISQMQNEAPAIPRLHVAEYNWWNEGLHGVARSGYATVFPQAIGLAATWDTDLIYHVADTISTEARAKYNQAQREDNHSIFYGLTFWSPNINIDRDPRWGRGQETYGEDPFLTGQIGSAFVRGLQGADPRYLKVVATAKHYAVHSGPESERHTFD